MTEKEWVNQFKACLIVILIVAVAFACMLTLLSVSYKQGTVVAYTASEPIFSSHDAIPINSYSPPLEANEDPPTTRTGRISKVSPITVKEEFSLESSPTIDYNNSTPQKEPEPEVAFVGPTEITYGSVEIPDGSELVYLGNFYITGYDICMDCCGKTDGITASGAKATVGRTVAATRDFSFGTVLYIDGIGARVVEDRGGMKGQHLDVLCEDHPACYAITGHYDVWEVMKTDEMP